MKEYHKINTLFKRDMANQAKIIEGDWSQPEFEYLKNNQWVFTEKVDGTNIRLKWESKVMSLGGKTDNAQIPATLLDAIRVMNLIPKLEITFPDGNACLHGEGYGAKIQKGGRNYRADQSFVLFDVKVGDWWLERENVLDVAEKLGLAVVPVIGMGTLSDAVEMVRNGLTSTWGQFDAEGIVMRPSTELKTRRGDRIIGKIKYVDFVKAAKAA